jgi:hypothetical protein
MKLGDLALDGKMLDVCDSCHRHLFIAPLKATAAMLFATAAGACIAAAQ